MPKWLSWVIRLAFVAAGFLFIAYQIDFEEFWKVIKDYEALPLIGAFLVSIPPYIVSSIRLNYLSGHLCGHWTCFKATLFCLGVNNIFPAKAGEVAKAFYLNRKSGLPLGQGLVMVFWERFFDLNVVLLLGVFSAWGLGYGIAVVPLGLVVGGIWVCLMLIRLFPNRARKMEKLVPGERLKGLFRDMIAQLLESPGIAFFLILAAYSLLFWLLNIGIVYACVFWVAGLDLTFFQVVTVFVAAALGMAVPSSPGALGVFEAAVVATLGWFNVPAEQALGVGLVMHATNYLPTTTVALLIMARSGLSMDAVRKGRQEAAS